MSARKKPEIDTLPMFPASVGRAPRRTTTGEATTGPVRVRPIGYVRCPKCSASKVAVVLSPTHVVYKVHSFVTWGGLPLPCHASGVALCQLSPRPADPGAAPITCPH